MNGVCPGMLTSGDRNVKDLTGSVPDTSYQMPCLMQGLGLSEAELGDRFLKICVYLLMGGWH